MLVLYGFVYCMHELRFGDLIASILLLYLSGDFLCARSVQSLFFLKKQRGFVITYVLTYFYR